MQQVMQQLKSQKKTHHWPNGVSMLQNFRVQWVKREAKNYILEMADCTWDLFSTTLPAN